MNSLSLRIVPGVRGRVRLAASAVALIVAVLLPLPQASAASSVVGVERGIRACVNTERHKRGLRPLADSPILDRAARFHARNMLHQGFFDHTDPAGRGPAERVALFDPNETLDYIGENIGAGYASGRAACVGWMNSAGHRANILDKDYTVMGGGFARGRRGYRTYFVQDFGMLKPAPQPGSGPAGDSGPSGGSDNPPPEVHHVVVHLFNVDDQETVYVNGNVVSSAGYGQSLDIDLGQLSSSDKISVSVDNFGGGYSWGISEETDGQTVLDDRAGTAGSSGANGNDQSSTGTVHRVTFDTSGTITDSYTVEP